LPDFHEAPGRVAPTLARWGDFYVLGAGLMHY